MRANSAPMSVADYCHDYNANKIVVNDQYQRNVGLWTSQAKSFFIESILLEYPIPKIYLHVRIDLKSRQQVKEVVDGQQRTQALVSFFNNKQRLTSNIDTEELRGLRYNQLAPEWQSRFLSYSLPIDQFPVATEEEIQESFRRMNANNVPLNDEEQRNARYQGPFKWFIIKLADRYKDGLLKLGLFSRRDLIRMADLKVYSEIVHVVDQGFHTVKGKQIDDLYKRYNSTFPDADLYEQILSQSIDTFLAKPELHRKTLLRGHMFQSTVLAIIDQQSPDILGRHIKPDQEHLLNRVRGKEVPLEPLLDALEDPESFPDVEEFTNASAQKTNVELSKLTRFAYLRYAI